jgi:hypothetical protein
MEADRPKNISSPWTWRNTCLEIDNISDAIRRLENDEVDSIEVIYMLSKFLDNELNIKMKGMDFLPFLEKSLGGI